MEATIGGNSSSPPHPHPPSSSSSNAVNGGASKYLFNLPSRGCFSSTATTVPSSNLGGMRVYISDHDTSPPKEQLIKTNQMNILIRSLLLKKQNHKNDVVKAIANSNNINETSASGSSTRKRGAATADGGGRAKRAATDAEDSLQSLTVERLRALLKEKGLSLKGKKDELIARLRSAS